VCVITALYCEESFLISAFVYHSEEHSSRIWTYRKRCQIDLDALGSNKHLFGPPTTAVNLNYERVVILKRDRRLK
jgi:hypothetical protein